MFLVLTNFKVILGFLGLCRANWGWGRDQQTVLGSTHEYIVSTFDFGVTLKFFALFMLTIFRVILGFFVALLGYFGVGLRSENSFEVSSYIVKKLPKCEVGGALGH